jgi:hypothetical protein
MSARKQGCFDHLPFVERRMVQDGHFIDGYELRPKAVSIKNFSAGAPCEAQHDKHWNKDPACTGCIWKTEIKKTELEILK